MSRTDLQKLEGLDLTQLTLKDVQELENPVLRRVLLDAITQLVAAPQHTSHAAHSNHYKTIAIERPDPTVGPA